MFDFDGPIYAFLKKLSDATILHIVWFITSLPIVTLGATTTALYGVALARKAGDRESVVGAYFCQLKKHWKKGTMLSVFLTVCFVLVWVNLYYWNYVTRGTFSTVMAMLCTALQVPLGLIGIYGFATITVAEELPFVELVKKILHTAYAHPLGSIKLVLCWGLIIWFNLANMFANVLFLMIGVGPLVQVMLAPILYRALTGKEPVWKSIAEVGTMLERELEDEGNLCR